MWSGAWIIFKGTLKGLLRRRKQRTEPQVIMAHMQGILLSVKTSSQDRRGVREALRHPSPSPVNISFVIRSALASCKTKKNPTSLTLQICQGRRNRTSSSRTCSRLFHPGFHCSCCTAGSTASAGTPQAGASPGHTVTLGPSYDKCGCTVPDANKSNKSLFILHFPNKRHERVEAKDMTWFKNLLQTLQWILSVIYCYPFILTT